MDSYITLSPLGKSAVVGFGSLLSFTAGIINGLSIHGIFKTPVAHVTGTTTQLGIQIAHADYGPILVYALLLLAFVIGSAISGGIVNGDRFRWSRQYGYVLIMEAIILGFAYLETDTPLPFPHPFPGATRGALWASLACGLQNALTTHFSSAVVRTTHVTGLMTDVGIILGRIIIRGDRSLVWRLYIFIPLWFSFMGGGIAAVLLFNSFHHESLLFVVGLTGSLGIGHASYRLWRQRHPILNPRWSLSGFFSPRSIAPSVRPPTLLSPGQPNEFSGLLSAQSAESRYRPMVLDFDSEEEEELEEEEEDLRRAQAQAQAKRT